MFPLQTSENLQDEMAQWTKLSDETEVEGLWIFSCIFGIIRTLSSQLLRLAPYCVLVRSHRNTLMEICEKFENLEMEHKNIKGYCLQDLLPVIH